MATVCHQHVLELVLQEPSRAADRVILEEDDKEDDKAAGADMEAASVQQASNKGQGGQVGWWCPNGAHVEASNKVDKAKASEASLRQKASLRDFGKPKDQVGCTRSVGKRMNTSEAWHALHAQRATHNPLTGPLPTHHLHTSGGESVPKVAE
jgi:hypothetical protein